MSNQRAVPRRRFVRRMLGTVAAAAAVPADGLARGRSFDAQPGWTPPLAALNPEDEAYWRVVKAQFPLRQGLTLMNAANLCPSPYSVSEAVTKLTRDVDSDASFHNRSKFRELRGNARVALAEYLGADPEEIALTRNTSEGNNTAIGGLTLQRDDEVVIWNENHPTNNVAWDVRAERYGFTVTRVTTPPAPKTEAELIAPFQDALSPRTKVLAITHVSSRSGVRLPVQALCRLARERNVVSLVDGAQTFGSLAVDLHDLGCDIYTGSAHKWFMGPKEAGVLYVRTGRIPALWPHSVGLGWETAKEEGARKFETLGQRDDAAVSALGTTVEFHRSIGAERVEARVGALAAAIKERLARRIPDVQFHTPQSPELSAGIVIFTWPDLDQRNAYDALYRDHGIACATTGGHFPGLRLSPHIYNTMDEVERVTEIVGSLAAARG